MEFIVGTLRNLFGVEATKIIVKYMEKKYDITKKQIPNNVEDFYTGLNSLLGKKASTTVQRFILATLEERIPIRV